ncbi:MAG TPA: transglutaminase-like domain-containing protein [Pirellulales bacterium]|jgi:hypothetical protein
MNCHEQNRSIFMPRHTTLSLHNMRFTAIGCLCATCVVLATVFGCNRGQSPTASISGGAESIPKTADGGNSAAADSTAGTTAPNAIQSALAAEKSGEQNPLAIDPTKTSAKGHAKQWWEAVYAYGAKIGWDHTEMTDLEEAGRKLVQVTNQSHLSVDRQSQRTTIDISTTTVETPTGEPVHFHSELISGPSRTETTGHIDDGQLTIETTTVGKTTKESFPWPVGTKGFSATEESLADSPLLPGQRRTLKALMPATNEVVAIDLVAQKYESTALLDHSEDLLRIDSTITMPMHGPGDTPPVIHSQLWTNREGEVMKTAMAALHQESFRTSRELALAESGPRRLDLVFDNTVPVGRPLADPHATRRIRYRVQLTSDDPAKVFANGSLQQVVSLDPHTAEITVRRIDFSSEPLGTPNSDAGSSKTARQPTEQDRAPNNLVQSDDEKVVAMARSVVPDETDPAKLAPALEKFVKQTIKLKDFSQAFATAAEVARLPEGDCTEHAVLLAALARARNIPARVAIGLVYQPSTQSFAYHMWNELWIADRWVPMDATLGRGGIGAAHLKLTDSNLAGAQAYSCFLPVAQVIGQIKIEILEVE